MSGALRPGARIAIRVFGRSSMKTRLASAVAAMATCLQPPSRLAFPKRPRNLPSGRCALRIALTICSSVHEPMPVSMSGVMFFA